MSIKLLTFDQALKKAESYGKKHLLLGNGFSIACKPDIFANGSLFEEAKKTMSNEQLAKIDATTGAGQAERSGEPPTTRRLHRRPFGSSTLKLLLRPLDLLHSRVHNISSKINNRARDHRESPIGNVYLAINYAADWLNAAGTRSLWRWNLDP